MASQRAHEANVYDVSFGERLTDDYRGLILTRVPKKSGSLRFFGQRKVFE